MTLLPGAVSRRTSGGGAGSRRTSGASAPATPAPPTRELSSRASKTAANAKLVEEDDEEEPAPTKGRAPRATRAALTENVAH